MSDFYQLANNTFSIEFEKKTISKTFNVIEKRFLEELIIKFNKDSKDIKFNCDRNQYKILKHIFDHIEKDKILKFLQEYKD